MSYSKSVAVLLEVLCVTIFVHIRMLKPSINKKKEFRKLVLFIYTSINSCVKFLSDPLILGGMLIKNKYFVLKILMDLIILP